jgi:hypothetical protein
MTQTITNYTTYDQAYYYADLKRLPRLSEEERRYLMPSLPTADNPHLTAQIKQQLIESYLPLAKYFAIALCPRSRYHRDLPDLIGEANLAVVEVITRADLTQIDDLTSYLAACVRGRLKGATAGDGLIKITHGVRARAREKGDADCGGSSCASTISRRPRPSSSGFAERATPPLTASSGSCHSGSMCV